MQEQPLKELLLQSLEQERGARLLYETALKCALDEELKEAWQADLAQTERQIEVLQELLERMGIDAEEQTPGRKILHDMRRSLVAATEAALGGGDAQGAQIVAAECLSLAGTKDALDWALLAELAKRLPGSDGKALRDACARMKDERLENARAWARELWRRSLGLASKKGPLGFRPAGLHSSSSGIGIT